jgi:nucleoid DNA-binding protein
MNREALVEAVTAASGLSREEVKVVLEHFLSTISDELCKGGRVELRGFGVFSIQERRPRPARNPRSGETVWLEERRVASFKPAQKLKQRIQDTQS